MGNRFDELDLLIVPPTENAVSSPKETIAAPPEAHKEDQPAPRLRRMLSLLVDLSLFLALGLAMSPLLPLATDPVDWDGRDLLVIGGISGFLLLLSYYYFTVCWLFWGKTIGGAIFDVRVVSSTPRAIDARRASARWAATLLSLLTGGIGFLPALLPRGRSVADRVSGTVSLRC